MASAMRCVSSFFFMAAPRPFAASISSAANRSAIDFSVRDRENWTERNLALACGIVRTAPDEMSVYWQEHLRHPTARLRRGVLRLDGFVSVNAG